MTEKVNKALVSSRNGSIWTFMINDAAYAIRNNNMDFFTAVQRKIPIACNQQGQWRREGIFMRLVRWLIGSLEDRRLAAVTAVFARFLEQTADHHPLLTPMTFDHQGNLSEVSVQRCNSNLAVAQGWLAHLKLRYRTRQTGVLRHAILQTQLSIIALKYRYEQRPRNVDAELSEELRTLAQNWKNTQLLAPEERALTPDDLLRLKDACSYPKFLRFLLKNPALQIAFFKWTIRNRNSVQAFVEYPAMQHQIRKSHLSSRFGYHNGEPLRVHKYVIANGFQKGLMLKCEAKTLDGEAQWLDLLNPSNEVILRNNYPITVQKIFKKFARKNEFWGKVEILADGLCNWHSGRMSRWNPERQNERNGKLGVFEAVDMEGEWWKRMPAMKWISLQDAKLRYAGVDLAEGSNWAGRNMATRAAVALKMQGTHAYREIAIPGDKEDQQGYRLYTFGKSATTFPHRWLKKQCRLLRILCKGVEYATSVSKALPGVIASPDPIVYTSHRQHGGTVFSMPPAEALEIMNDIKMDILRGRMGYLIYQLFVKNCAAWALKWRQKLGYDKVPFLYNTNFINSQPEGFLGTVFNGVRKAPPCFQKRFFLVFFWALGGRQGLWSRTIDGQPKQFVSLLNPDLRPWEYGNHYMIPASTTQYFEKGCGLH